MKRVNYFILIIAIMSFGNSYGQIAIGGSLDYQKLLGGSEFTNLGFSLRGELSQDEDKNAYTGRLSYYLPKTVVGTNYATASSSATSPRQVVIDDETKASFIHLAVGYRRYFAGGFDEDFNFYGGLGVGLMFAPVVYTHSTDYDQTKYHPPSLVNYDESIPGTKETLANFTIELNLGIEKDLSFGYIFLESRLVFPAGTGDETDISTFDIPTGIQLSGGLKFIM